MRYLLALFGFLMLNVGFAQPPHIVVLNPPSASWEQTLLARIDRVNDFLAPEFDRLPARVRIVRTHFVPEYDLQLGVLFLDESYSPVELYHEYAHLILDELIDSRSLAVRYFELRSEINHQSIEVKTASLRQELEEDEAYLNELRARRYVRMASNLAASISWSRRLQQRLRDVLPESHWLSRFYTRYQGATAEPSLYELVGPYHELFADTLAVVMAQRWDAIQHAQIERMAKSDSLHMLIKSDPDASSVAQLSYRAFQPDIELESFHFNALLLNSHYSQFAPVRAYIRRLLQETRHCSPAGFLYHLAITIADEIESRLTSETDYALSLQEMNRRLIDRLSTRVCLYAGL